jgi:hypothetical protein
MSLLMIYYNQGGDIMKENYPRVKLDTNPIEFYCPHCETIIVTHTEGEDKPIPKSCPKCLRAINTSGVVAYKGPIQ